MDEKSARPGDPPLISPEPGRVRRFGRRRAVGRLLFQIAIYEIGEAVSARGAGGEREPPSRSTTSHGACRRRHVICPPRPH